MQLLLRNSCYMKFLTRSSCHTPQRFADLRFPMGVRLGLMTGLFAALFPIGASADNERFQWGQTIITQSESCCGYASELRDGAMATAFDNSTAYIRRDFTVASSLPLGTPVQSDMGVTLTADVDRGAWGGSGHASLQVYSIGGSLFSQSVDGTESYNASRTLQLEVGGSYYLVIQVAHSCDPHALGLIGTAEGEMSLTIPVLDLVAQPMTWDTTNGGLNFSYTVQGGSLATATTAKLFWANGLMTNNIISNTPIFTKDIPPGFSGQSSIIHVPASNLQSPPIGATFVLLVVDLENLVAESNEDNNITNTAITNTAALKLSFLRVGQTQADVHDSDGIDDPIIPFTDTNLLSSSSPLGLGIVADGVTPVLLKLTGPPGRYSLSISYNAGDYYNGSFLDHLFVLQPTGSWLRTTTATLSSSSGLAVGYAYLRGFDWTDFIVLGSISDDVTVTVTLASSSNPSQTNSASFRIRPPPVALVHGYNADPGTWSPVEFIATLRGARPEDFIFNVGYGTDNGNVPNTTWGLDVLADVLDGELKAQVEKSPLLKDWAFTRYDVVGHSQGGVLARLQCQVYPHARIPRFVSTDVVGVENFFRGRFRRIITIGSPHNGSVLLRYILNLKEANASLFRSIPKILSKLAQRKFDPFDPQIAYINDPVAPVDPRIKFHCIRTTIASGQPPSAGYEPLCYAVLGLCQIRPSLTKSAGQLLLKRGSDGVVDFDSQGGGPGTQVTTFTNSTSAPVDLAHANVAPLNGNLQVFGVPPGHSQTTDSRIAHTVAQLLNGPTNEFGPFQLPGVLSYQQMLLIDSLIPQVSNADIILQAVHPLDSTDFFYVMQLPPSVPGGGLVSWSIEGFGTNGLSLEGVSMQVSPSDPNQVKVSVDSAVQGDVVLYAYYASTNGALVFGNPMVVTSRPAGATLSGIEIRPASASLSIGDKLATSVWGSYTNGASSLLYLTNGEVSYVSSNSNVAEVDSDGEVTMKSYGSATILASCRGFTTSAVVSSILPSIRHLVGAATTNGGFELSFVTTSGTTNVVEASTNLLSWVPVATLYNTNGFVQYTDTESPSLQKRFYRVLIAIPSITPEVHPRSAEYMKALVPEK